MSDYPTIKATDIRPGDTIRWERRYGAKRVVTTMPVSSSEKYLARQIWVKSHSDEDEIFDKNAAVQLVDRPAPKLPTTPGRLVYVEEFNGEKVEPPILAFLETYGLWSGERRFPDGVADTTPRMITRWSPATVTKATP